MPKECPRNAQGMPTVSLGFKQGGMTSAQCWGEVLKTNRFDEAWLMFFTNYKYPCPAMKNLGKTCFVFTFMWSINKTNNASFEVKSRVIDWFVSTQSWIIDRIINTDTIKVTCESFSWIQCLLAENEQSAKIIATVFTPRALNLPQLARLTVSTNHISGCCIHERTSQKCLRSVNL